jgi:hypothetical protein
MNGPEKQGEVAPVGDGSYVAKQGECIYSIAAKSGHFWKTLWDHPRNRALRDARKVPGVLLPGDRVFVPELDVKTLTLESGKRHRIVLHGESVLLRLRLRDADGEPIAKAKYRMEVAGQELSVTTNDEGYLEAPVPILAESACLTDLLTNECFTLAIGHMDPTGAPSAVRKRLANLGYVPEAEAGDLDEHLNNLLDEFREDAELDHRAAWDRVVHQLEEKEPWNT